MEKLFIAYVELVNFDLSFLRAGKGDASTPSGDASKRPTQNQGESESNDTMYIPSNLAYWRDVRASFVIPKLVRPNFCSKCSPTVALTFIDKAKIYRFS